MDTFFQDLKYALRMHLKAHGPTLVAIVTLALGMGATTAVFSVINTILLKGLPYSDPERIAIPWRSVPPELNVGYGEFPWGRPDFQVMQDDLKSFDLLSAFQSDYFNLSGSGDPVRLNGIRASAQFFPILGTSPFLGRIYRPDEDQPGHEHEVILSYSLWRDRFNGDRDVLGRTLDLNKMSYTIIGVMPPGFAFPRGNEMPASFLFPAEPQVWVPLALRSGERAPEETSDLLAVMGHLKPGATMEQAQAELNLFAKHREWMIPPAKGWFNSKLVQLQRQIMGETRRPLLLVLAAVAVVLLIACSNVANLLLTRSIARKREFALRAALGAGANRLVRQLLTEGLFLALGGTLLGIVAAELAIHFIKVFGSINIPRLQEVQLDFRVFAFTVGLLLVTGVFFGVAPAMSVTRPNLMEPLKEGNHRTAGGLASSRFRKALLVAEFAFALVLVVAAGLLSRTFVQLLAVDVGFVPERTLTFELSLAAAKYQKSANVVDLYTKVLAALKGLPEVHSVGLAENVPMQGNNEATSFRIIGRPVANPKDAPFANYTIVSPGFFPAVGTALLQGRDFSESDNAPNSLRVAIISRALAQKYWPSQDPIGKQLGVGPPFLPNLTVVGVVNDIKHLAVREDPTPEIYVLYTQNPYPSMQNMHIVMRSNIDPDLVVKNARKAVSSVDPDLPLANITSLNRIVDDSLVVPRFSMLLLASFGALALLLACIGMYGTISYFVAQRTQEIGVRMALGARRRNVFALVFGQGARISGLGLVIGIAVAIPLNRLMASFLYGVKATDPLTFAAVCLLLIGVTFLACYFPARRATSVDPVIALRQE